MKINNKVFHLPPYVSTSWNQVTALALKDHDLHIHLTNGTALIIPGLSSETLELIFNAHASYLNSEPTHSTQSLILHPPSHIPQNMHPAIPPHDMAHAEVVRFNLDNMESLNTAMQHNPAQANLPNIPNEILNKIAQVAKIVASDDIQNIPKPEPHCNCTHCQISRAIHSENPLTTQTQQITTDQHHEEAVSDKDLAFQQWKIAQTDHLLYSVVNRLDEQEKYSVHLGSPVGCTCGKSGCEHILAVLKS